MTIQQIQNIISGMYGIHVNELLTRTRKRVIVEPRQVSQYFCTLFTKNTLATIGYHHGKYDHATVMHSRKVILNLVETDARFKIKINAIKEVIENKIRSYEIDSRDEYLIAMIKHSHSLLSEQGKIIIKEQFANDQINN